MGCRQKLVLVAKMVLAKLAGGVAKRLQHLGNGRVFLGETKIGARQADLAEPGAEHALAGDEGRAARRATLLAIVIGEQRTLLTNTVDVRRARLLITFEAAGRAGDRMTLYWRLRLRYRAILALAALALLSTAAAADGNPAIYNWPWEDTTVYYNPWSGVALTVSATLVPPDCAGLTTRRSIVKTIMLYPDSS
jgi:hypothetical protein